MMLIYLTQINEIEDQNKFEVIYYHYKGLMFYVANQILNNVQDAEDACQQAFMAIADNIKKIDKEICSKTQNYVVTIVENKALDIYRKNKKINTIEYNDELDFNNNDTNISDLSDCILKLPLKYREVILLKYYQGFNLREIAKQMNISLANAIKIDQRAKKKLLEIYQKEEDL